MALKHILGLILRNMHCEQVVPQRKMNYNFASVSLKRYVSKYFYYFELYLVWNKCILNILLFYKGSLQGRKEDCNFSFMPTLKIGHFWAFSSKQGLISVYFLVWMADSILILCFRSGHSGSRHQFTGGGGPRGGCSSELGWSSKCNFIQSTLEKDWRWDLIVIL